MTSLFTSFSSNAILAKSRAMYGKRLSTQNYNDLLNCKSVGEIASYLKTRTFYSDIFEGVTPSAIHRGQLEVLLNKHVFKQYEILSKYELSIGQDFYKYFITRNDIEMILTCVRLLNTGNPEDYLLYMPIFFEEHTGINQFELSKVRSINDLLEALNGTEYKGILSPYVKNFDMITGKLSVEAAFNRYKYLKLKELVESGYKGKRTDQVLEVLKIQNDVRTIINIYRLKKLHGADKELIKRFIIPEVSRMSVKQLEMLTDTPNAEDMLELLNKTDYGKGLNIPNFEYIEDAAQRYLYKWNLKSLRFSSNPTVVMFCFIFLLENEISNVTHIIEGIRYKVSTNDLKNILIGIED